MTQFSYVYTNTSNVYLYMYVVSISCHWKINAVCSNVSYLPNKFLLQRKPTSIVRSLVQNQNIMFLRWQCLLACFIGADCSISDLFWTDIYLRIIEISLMISMFRILLLLSWAKSWFDFEHEQNISTRGLRLKMEVLSIGRCVTKRFIYYNSVKLFGG